MEWMKAGWSLLKTAAFSIVVPIAYFDCIGHPVQVNGCSMEPTLRSSDKWFKSDFVWLDRLCLLNYTIERGDIVTFVDPNKPTETYIKRVIGIQGDTIRTLRYESKYVIVPEGHLWVEGDKNNSRGSNEFGPVSKGLVQGKATRIIWPPFRWRKLPSILSEERRPVGKKTYLQEE